MPESPFARGQIEEVVHLRAGGVLSSCMTPRVKTDAWRNIALSGTALGRWNGLGMNVRNNISLQMLHVSSSRSPEIQQGIRSDVSSEILEKVLRNTTTELAGRSHSSMNIINAVQVNMTHVGSEVRSATGSIITTRMG